MDIKHSDPKLSVEEAWLTMTICITMILYISIWPVKRHYHIQYIALDILNIQTNDNLSMCVMAYGYLTSLITVLCAVMGICFIDRQNRSSRRKLPPSLKT
jgi:hypothetical protein